MQGAAFTTLHLVEDILPWIEQKQYCSSVTNKATIQSENINLVLFKIIKAL